MSREIVIVPCRLREASQFVANFHRHNKAPQGGLFAIGASDGCRMVGVAIVGRPVARHQVDGATAEVTRCCVLADAPKGTNSALYGASWRAARAMGYRRLITYTLQSESGASLRGAGWKLIAERGGARPERVAIPCRSRMAAGRRPGEVRLGARRMTVRILTGDCRDILRTLPDASVHCVVTSPPYFGLRDYRADGQIGLEATPAEFVERLVDIFREVRRVLRDDGSVFLNLGDSYAGSWGAQSRGADTPGTSEGSSTLSARQIKAHPKQTQTGSLKRTPGLKPKDLIGIPWRVAFALQADGWWLRADNIWGKPNGMPESTKDRATRSHEYVFHLTKSETYYYGYDDVRLPPLPESTARLERSMRAKLDLGDTGTFVVSGGGYAPPGQAPHQGARKSDKQRGHTRKHAGLNDRWDEMERKEQQAQGDALRSVWWIAPANFEGPHYAVMPDELAAVCILSGFPPKGVVLDPFGGVGTTGLVADRLQRDAVLIELNPENAAIARRRIDEPVPLLGVVA